jgi:glyoxylase-like metal-dependent hydrolase (beta-lactamase superfamily II)
VGNPFATSAGELRRRLPLSGQPGGALLVEGDHDVCDGVSLIHTPGETEGHQIVRVQTSDGRVYILGDLVHWAIELEDPRAQAPTSSPTELRQRVVAETQEEPSTLIFTHAVFPPWGTLTPASPDTWRWQGVTPAS